MSSSKKSTPNLNPAQKTWEFRIIQEAQVEALAHSLKLSPLAARLIAARGISDPATARSFFSPMLSSLHDPFLLKDMDKAVDRISRAMAEKQQIAIFGDYDVDGVTSTSILVRLFDWLGVKTLPYIPNRLNEGYGMSRKGIDFLAAQGIQLIVTVDNGINCNSEIEYAASLGIDVVVTDHHQPGDELPAAVAVVDPHRSDCSYPFKDLSGAGIAFKLAHALARHMGKPANQAKTFLKSLIDLVALGTVADIVPLLDENRVLVTHGLVALASTNKIGLQAMMERLGIAGKPLSGETIAFLIGPRLNAAGRIEDARYGLDLLLTENRRESENLVDFLEERNKDRRDFESDAFAKAAEIIEKSDEMLSAPALVVAGEGWHQGVLGIVASKLVERFGRPCIVLSTEEGAAKGSARSVCGFDIFDALHSCAPLLSAYGGHKMAAGLTLPVDQLDAFRARFIEVATGKIAIEKPESRLILDARVRIDELNMDAMEQINRLQPFGEGNPQPVVALMNCRLLEQTLMKGDKHLKIRICQEGASSPRGSRSMLGIAFGAGKKYEEIINGAVPFDVAGEPMVNEWNGRRSVELKIKDIRPSTPA